MEADFKRLWQQRRWPKSTCLQGQIVFLTKGTACPLRLKSSAS